MIFPPSMADGEAAAMAFFYGAIVLPIASGIVIVLWMILHQREHSKKLKEETKEKGKKRDVDLKHLLMFCLVPFAIIYLLGILFG